MRTGSSDMNFVWCALSDVSCIKKWLQLDPQGMKFLSSYATDDFFELIDFEKRYFWIVWRGNESIGFFDLEIESEQKGYFALYIREEFRGKGLGGALLQEALQLPEVPKVKVLEGGVEQDNDASRKTLEKQGFVQAYTDEDGMLIYQLVR